MKYYLTTITEFSGDYEFSTPAIGAYETEKLCNKALRKALRNYRGEGEGVNLHEPRRLSYELCQGDIVVRAYGLQEISEMEFNTMKPYLFVL